MFFLFLFSSALKQNKYNVTENESIKQLNSKKRRNRKTIFWNCDKSVHPRVATFQFIWFGDTRCEFCQPGDKNTLALVFQ